MPVQFPINHIETNKTSNHTIGGMKEKKEKFLGGYEIVLQIELG